MVMLGRDPVDADFVRVDIPGYYHSGETGSPSLPRYSRLFEAGRAGVVRIIIEEIDSVLYDLHQLGVEGLIVPSRPPARKGEAVPVLQPDTTLYNLDAWIGGPLVTVEYEGRMRGLSISNLHFNPVRYNPVQGKLKVYHHIRCRIEVPEPETGRPIPGRAFSAIQGRVVRQIPEKHTKAIRAEEPMTLVIVSDTMFREELRPLVRWKVRKGFRVVEAYLQDSLVGRTRESITAYLKALYLHPPEGLAPPSFLLIVGDVEQVPLSRYRGQVTDLYYAEYDGEEDYIPDVFYGRISVSTKEQLQGVVEKVLEYEQYRFPDPTFLDESVLIAGVDGGYANSYGNGQINYAHDHYLNSGNGNQVHLFPYPESGSSDQDILDLVSGGVGFVNYTGHGEYDRWNDPFFHKSDIEDLQNTGSYPVMIGNGCETNVFTVDECFAEALLRAPGKGALAYIGCTNESYWDEDYYWAVGVGPVTQHPGYEDTSPGFYDKVFHSHDEPYLLWTPSLGEMVFGGNMAVQQSSTTLKKFYWEIYQLAGDPTLVPWFRQPGVQEVVWPRSLPRGATRIDVSCAPDSYLALSMNGILLDALHATGGGYATLLIPDTISAGTLDLVVSGHRYEPWQGAVELGATEPVYLDLEGYALIGESVMADRKISPGETASLELELVNRGEQAIINDTLVLFSGNGSFEILDSLCVIGEVGVSDTLKLLEAFCFRAGSDLEDQSASVLGIRLKGSGTPLYIKEKIQAPVLLSGSITWDDRPGGNGNGIAETGEWLLCSWTLYNTGHFRTGMISGSQVPQDSTRSGEMVFLNNPVILPGDSALLQFRIRFDGKEKGWHSSGTVWAGDQHGSVSDSMRIILNRYYEDFSPGWSGRFPFVNDSVKSWESDGESFASPDLSLKSGKISHNQRSDISIGFTTLARDTLSFAYRVSSEYEYDFLRVYADSALVGSWSGYTDWKTFSLILEAGFHRVTWSYQKDYSENRGRDAAWIDDVRFPGSTNWTGDLSLTEILAPPSGAWLSDREQLGFMVRNSSGDTVQGFSAAITVNGSYLPGAHRTEPVLPGNEVKFMLEQSIDLSETGDYQVEVRLLSDTTGYPGNNSLKRRIRHHLFPDLSLSPERIEHVEGVSVDAWISVENAGNIRVDSFMYMIRMDDLLTEYGFRHIALDPGETGNLSFRLADNQMDLAAGTYEYSISAVLADSVMGNNQVGGSLAWSVTGLPRSGLPGSWQIYPNPSSNGFYLSLGEPLREESLFQVYSMAGRCVGTYRITAGSDLVWIPAEAFAPGRYLLRLVNTGESMHVVITP